MENDQDQIPSRGRRSRINITKRTVEKGTENIDEEVDQREEVIAEGVLIQKKERIKRIK
jgi:hypothetical protein